MANTKPTTQIGVSVLVMFFHGSESKGDRDSEETNETRHTITLKLTSIEDAADFFGRWRKNFKVFKSNAGHRNSRDYTVSFMVYDINGHWTESTKEIFLDKTCQFENHKKTVMKVLQAQWPPAYNKFEEVFSKATPEPDVEYRPCDY